MAAVVTAHLKATIVETPARTVSFRVTTTEVPARTASLPVTVLPDDGRSLCGPWNPKRPDSPSIRLQQMQDVRTDLVEWLRRYQRALPTIAPMVRAMIECIDAESAAAKPAGA